MLGQHEPMSRELAVRFEREALPFRDLLYRCALRLSLTQGEPAGVASATDPAATIEPQRARLTRDDTAQA